MNEFKIPRFLQQISIMAVIFIVIIGLKYTSSILGPIILSVFFSLLIYTFLMWLKKRGLSYNLSILLTLVGVFALGTAVLGFLAVTLAQLVKDLPNFSIDSSSFLAEYANQIIQFIISHIPVSNISEIVAMGIFILFATIFLVYELPQIKTRLIEGFGKDNLALHKSFALIGTMLKYFVIRVKVNFIYGIGVSAILFIFDINFAVLWGLLTFFLGFIPYLGITLAAIPPVLVAWAKYGIEGAIAIGILFIVINTIVESYIFPKLTGKGLQMSVYVVFASLFVWGWILGPSGFLVGVPLTLIIIKYLENFDETRWLALLMTSGHENAKKNLEEDTDKESINQ
ncbi:AI-2E family transporter [Methanobacterium oryzae]|uniref:AI-2E family transporter n=1 Tax=Methanobacterium oryzae TaxID=69540 RepID=UPI003D1BC8BB